MQTNARCDGGFSSLNSWWLSSISLGVLLLSLTASLNARANVYATNVRLNGQFSSAALYIPCGTVQISYTLNEPASAGVTIDIVNGTNVVHSIVLSGGGPGTKQGANVVIWDAHDDLNNLVPLATYAVRITAASYGYEQWTKISDEFNNPNLPGNYAWDPVGIAVNRNPGSPYYGRVFVANASVGVNPGFNAGDRVGILKLNADGSNPPDGADTIGLWNWAADGFSPWKLEVAEDDSLYAYDWSGGVVLSFDQRLTYESRRLLLRSDNLANTNGSNFNGPFVTGTGTNTAVWMADVNTTNSLGVRRWAVGANGQVASNDPGVTMVQAGGDSLLDQAPYDLAVDSSNRIYAIQYRETSGDASPRLLCFPPYTNSALPLTNAEWTVGSGDNSMRGASGVAVDPSGNLVAVAFRGVSINNFQVGGRTTIFSTADGSIVTNIVTDFAGDSSHQHTDVAWDNAGNLYDLDNSDRVWRVFSPPGSNAATTVAVSPLVVDNPPLAPILGAVSRANGKFTLDLIGRTNVNYVIETSFDFHGWTPVATNISQVCPTRSITVTAPLSQSFYRAYPLP